MFISSGKNHLHNLSFEDSLLSLGNVNYYKRYIIIENPNPGQMSSITIINISSSTGRDIIGVMSDSQRIQKTNIYHGYGNIFTPDMKLNGNSTIFIEDVSYGFHDYDLKRKRFAELESHNSYCDRVGDVFNYNTMPNVRFYTTPQHMLLEDNSHGDEYSLGVSFLKNDEHGVTKFVESVLLKDLMDSHTTFLKTKNSNYEVSEIYDENDEIIRNLTLLTIGPVTDLIIGLMLNEASFCYDTVLGVSKIKFKTDHKLPNSIYMTQLQGNNITHFQQAMDYTQTIAGFNFRLFVQATLGNVRLKFIKYDNLGNNTISKDFEFEVGEFRNDQHVDAKKWMIFDF